MEINQFLLTDTRSVWSRIEDKNEQMQLKRRYEPFSHFVPLLLLVLRFWVCNGFPYDICCSWLLGLSTSISIRKKLGREEDILEARFVDEK